MSRDSDEFVNRIYEVKLVEAYPCAMSYECTKEILNQMENKICKIEVNHGKATGFFCKIPFPNTKGVLPVLMTCNHVINENLLFSENGKIILSIKNENEFIDFDLENRRKYTSREYDITIIEIKKTDKINNFLELDDIIFQDIISDKNLNKEYIDKTIYTIHYQKGDLSVSYGLIKKIGFRKKYKFDHMCNTNLGSSGSPILGVNNKLIGIHSNKKKDYNEGIFLNNPIKEFILQNPYLNQKLLEDFKDIYDSRIESTIVNEIVLNEKNIETKGLNDLIKIKFDKLQRLELCKNNIMDISCLKNNKFNKLQILNLDSNNISDIKIFEKANFEELKELYLGFNQITKIDGLKEIDQSKKIIFNRYKISNIIETKTSSKNKDRLKKLIILKEINFTKLEKLYLNNNQILDINILEHVNFKGLKELNLFGNKISDIRVLEKVNFLKLERLILGKNKLCDINVLEKVNFKELKELDLSFNNISDISVLANAQFEKLNILNLEKNQIKNVDILEKANFIELKKINLSNNRLEENEKEKIALKLKKKFKNLNIKI